MKKLPIHIILMAIVNEVCGSATTAAPKNTGGKKQCLEAPVRTYALAKETFAFADIATAKTKSAWDTAKAAKDVVIFWDVESIEPNNTDAEVQNGRYEDYTLKKAVKGVDYRHNISVCSHAALESYADSAYTRIFRITDDDEITCEVQDDGSVKGEPLSSMLVGIRNDPTTDDVANSVTTFKFRTYEQSILRSDFAMANYEGIYDVELTESAGNSATSIKFKAALPCTGDSLLTLVSGNIKLTESDGVTPKAFSFVAADSNGEYELTGTGFANGMILSLDGVVTISEAMYETPETVAIANIS